MSLKIFYDHQIFSIQKFGGISRYFHEIISKNTNAFAPNIYTENFYLKGITNNWNFRGKIRLINYLNNIYTIIMIKIKNYDVFHPTYYDTYFLSFNRRPLVITVYDMIHEIYAGIYFTKNDKTISQKKMMCQKADGIIAISETTKRDLVNTLNINPNKIEVIYLGSNLLKKEKKIVLPKKYILFVGSRGAYKNFERFARAVSQLIKNDLELEILCVGSKFDAVEKALLSSLGILDRIQTYLAEDDEMYTIYKNAECFVFPSLYEGFGIPILEAYESDCPLLLSDIDCFREVAAEAGYYFDPEDIGDMQKKLEEVLSSEELKKTLIEKGKERLKEFSWEKTYAQTCAYYEKVVREKNNS